MKQTWRFFILVTSLMLCVTGASAQVVAQSTGLPASAPDAQAPSPTNSGDPTGTPVAQGKRIVETVMDKLDDKSLAKNALAVMNELLDDTRSAQARVYSAARSINRNLDQIESSDNATVTRARQSTRKLLSGSYSDALFQSRNLGDQIKTRLANLVADSLLMQTDKSQNLREDFLSELEIVTRRFVDAKRFRAGIGVEYIYLPKVSYAAATSVDLTPFQTSGIPLGDRTGFVVGFGNQTSPAARIMASGSGIDVSIAIPTQGQTRQIVTSVQGASVRADENSPDLLYRTTLTSTIKPELDASLSFSVLYVLDFT